MTIDLKQFCSVGRHPQFGATTSPHTFGDYTWATDGRILVRVAAVGPDTVKRSGRHYEAKGERFPDATLMPLPTDAELADPSLWTPWPAIDLALFEDEVCAKCDGTRRVRTADACPTCGGHDRPCPYCAGLPDDGPMPRAQKLAGQLVSLKNDEKVRALPNVRYRFVSHPSGTPSVQFAFEGGCGLLTPVVIETSVGAEP